MGEAKQEAGRKAWGTMYKTLMSPRCMNCHPAGDAPLQTDVSRPHAMNISRLMGLLNALNPTAALKRGYTITLGTSGKPLRNTTEALAESRLTTRFFDGYVLSEVKHPHPSDPKG